MNFIYNAYNAALKSVLGLVSRRLGIDDAPPPPLRTYATASTMVTTTDFIRPSKVRFDPHAPRPWLILPPPSGNVWMVDVEFSPFTFANNVRHGVAVVFASVDSPDVLAFPLLDADGDNFFCARLQHFLSSGCTFYGWNPSGDLATLRAYGYSVSIGHLDVCYGPGGGRTGPALKTCAATLGVPYHGSHAFGEVVTMVAIFKKSPPNFSLRGT